MFDPDPICPHCGRESTYLEKVYAASSRSSHCGCRNCGWTWNVQVHAVGAEAPMPARPRAARPSWLPQVNGHGASAAQAPSRGPIPLMPLTWPRLSEDQVRLVFLRKQHLGWDAYRYAREVEELVRHQACSAAQDGPSVQGEVRIAAHAKRLALELECLLLSTKDSAALSRWWDTAMEALGAYQAEVDAVYGATHALPFDRPVRDNTGHPLTTGAD